MQTQYFILWDNLYKKLIAVGVSYLEMDIRYLPKWIKSYPEIFPKFMRDLKYIPIFHPDKFRWEIYKTL